MLLADQPFPDGSWPDTDDPARRWAMPAGLAPATGPDGAPRFLLARWAADEQLGGLLQFELDVVPSAVVGADPVPWSAARARIVTRSGNVTQAVRDWYPLPPAGVPLVTVTELLGVDAIQLLDAGLHSAGSVVEVSVEAQAHAVAGSLPALVSLDLRRVAPLLPAEPWTVDELTVALGNLQPDVITCVPLDARPLPARADLIAELAPRLAADLDSDRGDDDVWTPTRVRLPDPLPDYPLAYDLRIRRPAVVTFRSGWSVTGWVEGLDDAERAAVFPRWDGLAPFGVSPTLVVVALPLDSAAGVRSVQVDVTATGTGGVPERHSVIFDGTTAPTRRLDLAHPLWGGQPFAPVADASAVRIDGAGVAHLVSARPVTVSGPLVSVAAADLGLAVTTVDAEPEVFTLADQVRVTVGDAGATLTGPGPAHLAYPSTDDAVVEAVVGDTVLFSRPVTDRVTVTTADLLDTTPDLVEVRIEDPAARSTFTALTLEDPVGSRQTLVLQSDEVRTWPCRRRSKLDPLAYRWRLDWIPRTADGGTAPLVSTTWTPAHDFALTVTVRGDD